MNSNKDYRKFPDPLDKGKWFNIGLWAPPAIMLSWVSLLAGVIIFWFLQRGSLQTCFTVQNWDGFANPQSVLMGFAVAACLLVWWIVVKCGRRPGTFWPHLWAPLLAISTTIATIMQIHRLIDKSAAVFWLSESRLDAFTIACIAATIALSPRLLRLYPDSHWVERVAPVSLLGVLAVFIPAMYFIAGDITAIQDKKFNIELKNLRETTTALTRCNGDGESCSDKLDRVASSLLNNSEAQSCSQESIDAKNREQQLAEAKNKLLDIFVVTSLQKLGLQIDSAAKNQTIDPNINLNDLQKWLQQAEHQQRITANGAIYQTYQNLLKTVIATLDQAPVLNESPVKTEDSKDGPWPENPYFPDTSNQVIAYYRSVSDLFNKMGALVEGKVPDLQTVYQEAQSDWNKYLQKMENNWSTHWLAPYLTENTNRTLQPLTNVLGMPVLGTHSVNNIGGLFKLGKQDVIQGISKANCIKKLSEKKENTFSYQCRTYITNAKGDAELRVDFRLLYEDDDKPKRILLFIPFLPANAPANEPGRTEKNLISELRKSFPDLRRALERLAKQPDISCPDPEHNNYPECVSVLEYSKNPRLNYFKIIFYPDVRR